ncbi:hypothetical protein DNZ44_00635 [Salmonella enterica subsp. enterica serovar Muenchen]|nr:hypothetical protein [Salmonella enterica subsp. enterica serovar Muenchen]EBZ6827631.1 hypothetical protein [Salmonella enterica subsp. enterica serovar Newport]
MKNYRCCFCGRSREKVGEGFVISKYTDEALCDSCITDIVILLHNERKVAEKLKSIQSEDIIKS